MRCCSVTAAKPVGLKVYWRGPRAQWLRTPHPALSVRQVGGMHALLFSLSNKITSYGDRYPEGRTTEESNTAAIHPNNSAWTER